MRWVLFLFIISINIACSSHPDGRYCADVDYYNARTGQQSNYTLIAKVSNGKLKQLDFPSGGHIDEGDYGLASFDSDGVAVASIKGKTYRVTLLKKGIDCFSDVPTAKQCKGTTANGDRCKNKTDNRSGYCWQHS